MAKIVWDKIGERIYETGIDHGVLYLKGTDGKYPNGVPWNGLINVSENPTGAEANPQYADNIKYLNLVSAEEFEASIEAFTYPEEFAKCDGSFRPTGVTGVLITGQPRSLFGLAYRSRIGDDIQGTDLGYKLHLVYEALAAPTDKSYATISESPEAMTFSWDITTSPISFKTREDLKPTAHMVIDSRKVPAVKLQALEDKLFGTVSTDATLPLPDEIITLLS